MDEYDNQDPLYEHVRKEIPLSNSEYERYIDSYSCNQDTIAYRGICCRNKSDFNKIIKKLENGEYYPEYPSSFTTDYTTALSFARSRKTLFAFLDENIAIENSYSNITNENINGYAGIVIKTIIPKGEGLDLRGYQHAIENEIVYRTDKPITYSYEIINSYENELKEKNINIDEYIQSNELSDGLSEYIITNHARDLNENTQRHIFNILIKDIKETDSLSFVDQDFKKVIFEQKGFNFHNNDEVVSFYFKDIMKFYEKGLFQSPEMFNKIQCFADDIIHSVCEFIEVRHVEKYHDSLDFNISYDLKNLQNISHISSEFARERLKQVSNIICKKSYHELNNELRSINNLDEDKKKEFLKNKTNEIVDFLSKKLNSIPNSKEYVDEKMKKREERRQEIIKKGKNLKNL